MKNILDVSFLFLLQYFTCSLFAFLFCATKASDDFSIRLIGVYTFLRHHIKSLSINNKIIFQKKRKKKIVQSHEGRSKLLFFFSSSGRKYERTMIDKMVLSMVLFFHFDNQWGFIQWNAEYRRNSQELVVYGAKLFRVSSYQVLVFELYHQAFHSGLIML